MHKVRLLHFISLAIFCLYAPDGFAQDKKASDTLKAQSKRRLVTRLMKSISRSSEPLQPVKSVNPFLQHKGKIIRSISIIPLGFDRNLYDTSKVKKNYPTEVANQVHRNSTVRLIRKNLFFDEGDKVLPLLLADNERFLRDQDFLQDALILVGRTDFSKDSIDIVIFTKDVFSIGFGGSLGGLSRARIELREENLAGTGDKLTLGSMYDKNRDPHFGQNAEFVRRNIHGSFINWTIGFKSYNDEIATGRKEENHYYTKIEKPLVSRYSEWTGAVELSLNRTANNYLSDSASLYSMNYEYSYHVFDLWGGYNFGSRIRMQDDSKKRLRHFVGMRSFYTKFEKIPGVYKDSFDYKYSDINGALISYSLYRQNFYRTNFIYGFGRNEDVPEGINATVIGGYTNKEGIRRAYYGLDFDATHYSTRGFFSSYTVRAGSFVNNRKLEDIDLLLGIDHFTRLRMLGNNWRNRNFLSIYYTKQYKTRLNEPLFLSSAYGLPYFRNGDLSSDTRATVKAEGVFYNLKKIAGFRVAPFIFSDLSFLKPSKGAFGQTKLYSAYGGGFRMRNENLIFGTIEVRAYIFPKPVFGMRNWKLDATTNLRFKYNSSFIRRPEFVVAN